MESKNDTIVAAFDVLMKNERIVDDVQAVDDVVSNHEKAVVNVVSNLLQPEPIKHTITVATTTVPPRYCCRHHTTGRDPTTIPWN
nr:hypothetical protein [Tanacetum cinerariifolium]